MPLLISDTEAFDIFPGDRHWYDKLFVARTFGYKCGELVIPTSGKYIVRPRINLNGCGEGATIKHYRSGDLMPSGMFWCEVFEGRHITIDYVRQFNYWVQCETFEGVNSEDNLIEFKYWKNIDYDFPLPEPLRNIKASHVNIEIIDGRVIEVHLRSNPDPIQYDEFWPIWTDDQQPPFPGATRIPDRQRHLHRKGFYVQSS
jgi:hypothetical protein